jgi:hypothetical protein
MKLEQLSAGILAGAFNFFISTQECLPGLGKMAQAFLNTLQRNKSFHNKKWDVL